MKPIARGGRHQELIEDLLGRGWVVDRITGTGHLKLMHPNGEFIIVSRSPSDHRAWKNLRAQARRIERA